MFVFLLLCYCRLWDGKYWMFGLVWLVELFWLVRGV